MALADERLRHRASQTVTPAPTRRAFLALGAATAASAFTSSRAAPLMRPRPAVLAPPAGAGSLGAHAAACGLLYGCAVDIRLLNEDPAYAALVRAQTRIVVAEGSMKWGSLRPSPTTFRFAEADAFVAFAEAAHLKIRGHCLVWHRNNPPWLDTSTQAQARQLLVNHIETVCTRYAGRMHSWDVVNEGIEPGDGRPDGLRVSSWLRIAGDDYIELAFRTARAMDPDALLAYNDYGLEGENSYDEARRQAVLLLLRRLITRNVPIDAVGIQSHLTALTVPAYGPGLMRFIAAVRQLGLQVFLSELDVNDRDSPASQPFRDAAVAATYRRYLDTVLADPAVRAVLTWGITDKYTWLNSEGARTDKLPERDLPFDADMVPTPAFYAMREAFDRRPSPPPPKQGLML
jgi:endo-1,4-beta-xylanase